jgi:hypothetical protein
VTSFGLVADLVVLMEMIQDMIERCRAGYFWSRRSKVMTLGDREFFTEGGVSGRGLTCRDDGSTNTCALTPRLVARDIAASAAACSAAMVPWPKERGSRGELDDGDRRRDTQVLILV